jgi:hypothetical protein
MDFTATVMNFRFSIEDRILRVQAIWDSIAASKLTLI